MATKFYEFQHKISRNWSYVRDITEHLAQSSGVRKIMYICTAVVIIHRQRSLINQSINQSVNFYSGLSDRSHFEDH